MLSNLFLEATEKLDPNNGRITNAAIKKAAFLLISTLRFFLAITEREPNYYNGYNYFSVVRRKKSLPDINYVLIGR